MHVLKHLVRFKNIFKNNKNTNVANMLRTTTTTPAPTYGIYQKSTSTTASSSAANKHFGLMSMQLLVVLLVFLLADSGLNGLNLVTALKGKFQIDIHFMSKINEN